MDKRDRINEKYNEIFLAPGRFLLGGHISHKNNEGLLCRFTDKQQQVQAVVPPHRVQQWSVASPQGIAHGSQPGSLLVGSAGASLRWVPWTQASSPPCQTSHSPGDRPIQHTAQCLKL